MFFNQINSETRSHRVLIPATPCLCVFNSSICNVGKSL